MHGVYAAAGDESSREEAMSDHYFGYDPQKIRKLLAEIRLRLQYQLPAELMNGGGQPVAGDRPVLTIKADTEDVIIALEKHLTPEELRKIHWVLKG